MILQFSAEKSDFNTIDNKFSMKEVNFEQRDSLRFENPYANEGG